MKFSHLKFLLVFLSIFIFSHEVLAAAVAVRRQQMAQAQQAQEQAQIEAYKQAMMQQQAQQMYAAQMAQQQQAQQQQVAQYQDAQDQAQTQAIQQAIVVHQTEYNAAAVQQALIQQQVYQQAAVEQTVAAQQQAQAMVVAKAVQQRQYENAIAQQMGTQQMDAMQKPYESVPKEAVKAVADISDVWKRLDKNSKAWTLLIDNQARIMTVAEYMDRFKKEGAKIYKSPTYYATTIDSMIVQNPALLAHPFKDLLQIAAIVDYDFDTGADPDILARKLLGPGAYEQNKKRLGR